MIAVGCTYRTVANRTHNSSVMKAIASRRPEFRSPPAPPPAVCNITLHRAAQQRLRVISRGAIEMVNQEQLEVVIADREKPIIVDFFATWCGPCVMLSKELEKVASELGDAVRIVKVDVDQNQDLASQLQISGLPTLIFIGIDRTKPALRTEGLLPADTIKDIVTKEL